MFYIIREDNALKANMKEWLLKISVSILAALAPIQPVMISVGVIIFTDMITGIWAGYKRGDKIKSAKLRRTVTKFFIYQMVIISGYYLETNLLLGSIPVVKLLSGLIGVVEFTSILENANAITGTNLFAELIKRLGSVNDQDTKEK